MRLTPLGHSIGLADDRRLALTEEKRRLRDEIITFARDYSVKAAFINDGLEVLGTTPLKQGVKLIDLIQRPQLTIANLAVLIPAFAGLLDRLPADRREEIMEAAEILIKYDGYIARERQNAEKLHRLENIRLPRDIDYNKITAITTEARQKLERIRPVTIGQASRIPGVSPSDINILLLLMNR